MRMSPIRITGLNSGLDTDSMVKALSASYQTKIDKIYKQNESVKYKKETWEELNSKMYSFYTGALSDAKYKKAYSTSDITSIKNFINGYNDVVEEMSTKYNTKPEGYEPLTSEEKDALSDRELEKWEDKIKDSSLYRDSRLSTLRFKFTQTMVESIEMNDGAKMYLSDFGITRGNYFNTPANERDSYKIDEEKLQKMIDENPDKVEEFFSKLSSKLYDTTTKEMSSTSSSSLYKVYNDKQLTKQQQAYEKEMLKIEEQMFKTEERYYKQFAQMEEMLASINSQTNMFTTLLGM
jgi:flagellar hook-associated protein 2